MNMTPTNTFGGAGNSHGMHRHRDSDSGPYRDEDVLLNLQLLAYLSKYPHVCQAFYKPRVTFHPASVDLSGARFGLGVPQHQSAGSSIVNGKQKEKEERVLSTSVKETFLKAFSNSTSAVPSLITILRPRGGMQTFVKTLTRKIITLEVESSDTIDKRRPSTLSSVFLIVNLALLLSTRSEE